ncbi:retrovirus-related pol polyprotein from transposon TNT 1-94 [Tanacetum coccineum]
MVKYQKKVNEIRAKKIAKNANPLALVAAAQPYQDPYYQAPKSHKSYAPTSKASLPTRFHATTKHKGKEIAKPITPPSESASKEDNDLEQAQKDKEMQKNLALIAKYFKKLYKPTNNNLRTFSNTRNKNVDTTPRYKNDNQTGQFGNQRTMTIAGARETVGGQVVQQSGIQCFNCKEFSHFAKECRKPKRVKDSTYHKEKMLLCKQTEKGVPLQAEQSDWLADTDEEIDEQELAAHYSYLAKIQEVPTADSQTDSEPLEQVQYDTGYNVFANEIQHSDQSESISNTCVVETGDSNVIPDSPNMCDDERVTLANLITNLKLNVDEKKKIQKQLKKANASLTQELTECKSILADTSRSLGESNKIVDQAWVKHSKDHFCALTAHDMEILIKTCLMPLALKTQNDSFVFVQELKQEMHVDLKYVESLEKEVDGLESNKAEFSNMYDMLLQECVSNDVMCSYLHSLSDLDAHTELQCLYLHKVKECMYRIDIRTTQTREPQLLHTSMNTNPHMSISTEANHRTNVSRPHLRSTQMKDKVVPNTSQVKLKKTEVEDHHRISSNCNQTKSVTAFNDSLKSRTSNVNVVYATCGKCVFNSNHDACISKYLNDVNARTKKPKVVLISTRKPKSQANKSVATPHKKTVASETTIQNSKSYYKMLYEKLVRRGNGG